MKKVTSLTLLALTFSLVGCAGGDINSSSSDGQNKDVVGEFLSKARLGFEMNAISNNDVFNKISGEKLFTNSKSYHHVYDNHGKEAVIQSVTYPSSGQSKTDTVRFIKDEEGFLAKEFINYKNEVDTYRFGEELGARYIYDELFMNPFKFIYKEDLIQDEENENVYHLVNKKVSKFENYIIATGKPSQSVTFTFNEEGVPTIDIKSVELNGKAQLQDKTYVAATWTFHDLVTLANVGEAVIPSLEVSSGMEQVELKNKFSQVKTNYTLTTALSVKDQPSTPETTQVMYVTDEGVYVDANKAEGSEADDRLFKKGEFDDDGLLYEHFKSETSWDKVPCDYETSYNINPHDISYFTPHLSEIATNLFSFDMTNKSYKVNNAYAITNFGNAFLSDYNASIYFDYGYGLDVNVKLVNNDIKIILDFIAVYDGAAYPMTYNLTYTNIGQTTLPVSL